MGTRIEWEPIEADVRAQLRGVDSLELDRALVERFAEEIAAGRLSQASNRVPGDPEPPAAAEIDETSAFSAVERARLASLGRQALERGELAVAVLNGGMATRFGGAVKGIVEAVGGKTFLELKLAQARRFGPVPFAVMNSFATHRATVRFLAERGLEQEGLFTFLQSVSLRLTPEGQPFRDAAGHVSLYAPGHGDFPEALRRSGTLAALERRGVRALLLSNVDNLGAEPDPLVVGYRLSHGRPLTVEVARSVPGEVGGAPARVGGRLQVVEGFRFPPGFDFDRLPYVNTNTFALSLEALAREYPLTRFYVEKRVDGRVAIQVERLVGELSAFLETAYLGVPRSGVESRYFPIKSQADLEALQSDPVLVERFTAGRRL